MRGSMDAAAVRRARRLAITFSLLGMTLTLVALLSQGCASFGTGDPVVVRAEDVLSNSLPLYSQAMAWHKAHSTEESPEVYAAFEKVRTTFPKAWRSANVLKKSYKASRTAEGKVSLTKALDQLDPIVDELRTIWGGAL